MINDQAHDILAQSSPNPTLPFGVAFFVVKGCENLKIKSKVTEN